MVLPGRSRLTAAERAGDVLALLLADTLGFLLLRPRRAHRLAVGHRQNGHPVAPLHILGDHAARADADDVQLQVLLRESGDRSGSVGGDMFALRHRPRQGA